ncbi:MAG: hypothetical protein HAW59_00765 [Betaproteobacteria bacterium]|nr:hypothetical protein [Betaproteobacteria bacterium]
MPQGKTSKDGDFSNIKDTLILPSQDWKIGGRANPARNSRRFAANFPPPILHRPPQFSRCRPKIPCHSCEGRNPDQRR